MEWEKRGKRYNLVSLSSRVSFIDCSLDENNNNIYTMGIEESMFYGKSIPKTRVLKANNIEEAKTEALQITIKLLHEDIEEMEKAIVYHKFTIDVLNKGEE